MNDGIRLNKTEEQDSKVFADQPELVKTGPGASGHAPAMTQLNFRYVRSIHDLDEAAWDALLPRHITTCHAWLRALEDSGLVGAKRGVRFHIPVLTDDAGRLLAAAPGVIKANTLGEYGPENHWMRQAKAAGYRLLPKYQLEAPATPVGGPRLLTHGDGARGQLAGVLLKAILDTTGAGRLNALTIARMTAEDEALAAAQDMVISYEIGSRWRNEGYASHADFLSRLKAGWRYDIRQERKAFGKLGLNVRMLRGGEIRSAHWDAFYAGYVEVCKRHRSATLLNREFFDHLSPLGDAVWLIGAFSGDVFKAGCFCLQSGDAFLSRTWSEFERISGVGAELALHRPIELAIELGLSEVDCGVWGEHKSKRGFEPVAWPNAHWLRDPQLRALAKQVADQHYAGFLASQTPPWRSRYFRDAPERSTPERLTPEQPPLKKQTLEKQP